MDVSPYNVNARQEYLKSYNLFMISVNRTIVCYMFINKRVTNDGTRIFVKTNSVTANCRFLI